MHKNILGQPIPSSSSINDYPSVIDKYKHISRSSKLKSWYLEDCQQLLLNHCYPDTYNFFSYIHLNITVIIINIIQSINRTLSFQLLYMFQEAVSDFCQIKPSILSTHSSGNNNFTINPKTRQIQLVSHTYTYILSGVTR